MNIWRRLLCIFKRPRDEKDAYLKPNGEVTGGPNLSDWKPIIELLGAYGSGKLDRGQYDRAMTRLVSRTPNMTALVAAQFKENPSRVFQVAPFLSAEQIIPLTDTFLDFCLTSQMWPGQSREVLLRLPRPFLVEKMRQWIDFLRAEGTYWEFMRFLELADGVDRNLHAEVMELARNSDDPDIREVTEFFDEPVDEKRTAGNPNDSRTDP